MDIKSILRSSGFKFDKSFGQNFIFDMGFLKSVAAKAEIDNLDVLEIGPGAGNLTLALCQRAKKVVAYEIDLRLKDILAKTLANEPNTSVVFSDALKAPLAEIESHFEESYVLVANLPYYITTPLIFKFLQSSKCSKIVVMVQKEVGERLMSMHGKKTYGALTVNVGAVANVSLVANAPAALFTPAPNVDSVVVAITKTNINHFENDKHKANFDLLVRAAFENRRKMFASNICKAFAISREAAENALRQINVREDIRGEMLSVVQFVQLAKIIK